MVEAFGLLVTIGFTSAMCFATVLSAFFRKGLFKYIAASLCIAILCVSLGIFFESTLGNSSLPEFFRNSIQQEKLNLVSLLAGASVGLLSGYAIFQTNESILAKSFVGFCLGATLLSFLLVFVRQQYPSALYGEIVDSKYLKIETIATLTNEPICLCLADSGEVFVSFESFLDGREGSGIWKFRKNDSGSWDRFDSGLEGLFARTNGMVHKDGALYISRSGRLVHADPEKLNYVNSGAVTRCLDTDKDGRLDYFEDIIKDLPGLQIPDSQHANNGISFDKEGNLYLGIGTPTNRSVQVNPVEGTILKYRPPTYEPSVFAQGFRNPFGMVMNQNGELFITDNDTNNNKGDEVNLVYQNQHYGHPYVLPGDPQSEPSEFTQPIWVGGPASNIVGVTYLGQGNLPLPYQDSLLVTDLPNNLIYQLKLKRDGGKVTVSSVSQFARIPRPVGLVFDGKDSLYVISRRPDNKLYKITFTPL